MAGSNSRTSRSDSTANLGFEAKLWLAADKLLNNMDAAKYKHVVLGLIFLGKDIDDAMVGIERDNPRLKGVLRKEYARPALDKHRLGKLIDLIGTIVLGDKENRAKEILGRVYEYFLGPFAESAKLEHAIKANLRGLGYGK
jgi:type I restriction-modification system DNA methylase subunit